MRFGTISGFILAGLFTCVVAADAGQVRINVGSNLFDDNNVSVKVGDQVVWVWVASGHSVTQGTPCVVSNPLFDSGVQDMGSTFSWKADQAGSIQYFCIPHCGTGMTGVISVVSPSAQTLASDFRITEVRTTAAHTADFVEISNLGNGFGNLGRYRISVGGNTVDIPLTNVDVPINGRVVVHFGVAGANTLTDIYFPDVTVPATGSAALYVPNTANASLADPDMLVDFVQWGAAGQANQATAVAAGFWGNNDALGATHEGHSYEFCGEKEDRGAPFWLAISVPNPGGYGDCSTPTIVQTWGGIKAIYR
jgi:plastocyanin